MLNFSYRTRFFGHDLFQLPPDREHAFPGTYEKLGYVHGDVLTILEPQRKLEQLRPDFATGDATPVQPVNQSLVDDAVAYYQVASEQFKDGKLKRRPEDSTKVEPLPVPASSVPAPAGSVPAPASSTGSATPPAY